MELRNRILEIRHVPAKSILPSDFNWRTHPAPQIESLAGSIEELGFIDPLDTYTGADGSLKLIDGHARRLLIHERIGPDTLIPCNVTDLSEAEAKKANLIKDPLAAMAEADKVKLDALLREVQTSNEGLSQMLGQLAADSNLYQVNSGEPDDPNAHWQGMPEFEHESSRTAFRSLIVHFVDKESVRDFAERIGQSFSLEAKYVWHPKRVPVERGHYLEQESEANRYERS